LPILVNNIMDEYLIIIGSLMIFTGFAVMIVTLDDRKAYKEGYEDAIDDIEKAEKYLKRKV